MGVSMLRPLRILLPFVAIGVALLVFLSVAFVAFTVGGGTGPGGPTSFGPCDAGLSAAPAGTTVADLSDEQRQNANVIVSTARGLGAPPRAWVIALATAMQESTLRNIPYGDRDSEGLFQQRPSQGWGTQAQVTDPVYATTQFIQRLLAVPGWDAMALTDAAQIVQRSAFPDAYRKWEGLATQLVTQLGQVRRPGAVRGPGRGGGRGPGGDQLRPRGRRQALRVGRHRPRHLRLLRPHAPRVPEGGRQPPAGVAAAVQRGRARARHVRPSPATCCSSPRIPPIPRPSTT